MRNNLKKESPCWENTINVEGTSDSIKIKMLCRVTALELALLLLHGLMQSTGIKNSRWFTTGCIRGFPLILKL